MEKENRQRHLKCKRHAFGTMKGLKQLRAKVQDDVLQFFDDRADNLGESRGRVLEILVDIGKRIPPETFVRLNNAAAIREIKINFAEEEHITVVKEASLEIPA